MTPVERIAEIELACVDADIRRPFIEAGIMNSYVQGLPSQMMLARYLPKLVEALIELKGGIKGSDRTDCTKDNVQPK